MARAAVEELFSYPEGEQYPPDHEWLLTQGGPLFVHKVSRRYDTLRMLHQVEKMRGLGASRGCIRLGVKLCMTGSTDNAKRLDAGLLLQEMGAVVL